MCKWEGVHTPLFCAPSRAQTVGARDWEGAARKGGGAAREWEGARCPSPFCARPRLREVGAARKPAPPRPGFRAGATRERGARSTRNEAPAPRLLRGVRLLST